MTMLRDPVTNAYMGIVCDGQDCPVMAPESKVLLEHHGLINMGWKCTGGTHYCPAHADGSETDALHTER